MPAVQHQQRPVTVHSRSDSLQSLPDKRSPSAYNPALMANSAITASQAPAPNAPPAKKSKGKRNADPVDTNKLLEQTMARLERETAGDKEQEAEIGRFYHSSLDYYAELVAKLLGAQEGDSDSDSDIHPTMDVAVIQKSLFTALEYHLK